jgi:hypothetical protein
MANPQIKYDRRGHAYYDYGWGGKISDFAGGFMKGMEIAQNLKDKEEARRLMRKRERMEYDKLSPEEQEAFIRKAPAQDLLDLGLADPKAKGDEPAGPVEPGQPSMKKARYGELQTPGSVTLRPKVIRDKTLIEKGQEARAQVEVEYALKGAALSYETNQLQKRQYEVAIDTGEYKLSKEKEDDETKKRYMDSGIPVLMSLANPGHPPSEFYEAQTREKFPDQAFREDQIKFGVGPVAEAMQEQRFREFAEKQYTVPGDQKKWIDAMMQAQFEGKFDKMKALPPAMSTFAMAQLRNENERIALSKQQLLQTENHFTQSQAQALVGASGGQLDMSTAMQWVTKHSYGVGKGPELSEGAATQIGKWEETLAGQRAAASATAFYDLKEKQGKARNEAKAGLRSSIGTLLQLRKEKVQGKPLEQQMLLIKDELIKMELEDLNLSPTGPEATLWGDIIWKTAMGTMGAGEFAGAVATDAAKERASVAGSIVKDVVPQPFWDAIHAYTSSASEMYGKVGTQVAKSTDLAMHPDAAFVDWSMEGSDLGKAIFQKLKDTPGVRIQLQEYLKGKQSQYAIDVKASDDPLIVEDRLKKIDELSKVLRGMGVQ